MVDSSSSKLNLYRPREPYISNSGRTTELFKETAYVLPLSVWIFLNLATAAAAKSLQSCPTLCDPRDDSPPGSPVPGILQARTLEWVAISFSMEELKNMPLSEIQ